MLKGRGIRKVEKHCVKTVYRVLVRECPHWREKREPGGGYPSPVRRALSKHNAKRQQSRRLDEARPPGTPQRLCPGVPLE